MTIKMEIEHQDQRMTAHCNIPTAPREANDQFDEETICQLLQGPLPPLPIFLCLNTDGLEAVRWLFLPDRWTAH